MKRTWLGLFIVSALFGAGVTMLVDGRHLFGTIAIVLAVAGMIAGAVDKS